MLNLKQSEDVELFHTVAMEVAKLVKEIPRLTERRTRCGAPARGIHSLYDW